MPELWIMRHQHGPYKSIPYNIGCIFWKLSKSLFTRTKSSIFEQNWTSCSSHSRIVRTAPTRHPMLASRIIKHLQHLCAQLSQATRARDSCHTPSFCCCCWYCRWSCNVATSCQAAKYGRAVVELRCTVVPNSPNPPKIKFPYVISRIFMFYES